MPYLGSSAYGIGGDGSKLGSGAEGLGGGGAAASIPQRRNVLAVCTIIRAVITSTATFPSTHYEGAVVYCFCYFCLKCNSTSTEVSSIQCKLKA